MCRRILYQSWDNIQRRSKEEQTEETGSSVKVKSVLVKQQQTVKPLVSADILASKKKRL